MFSFTYLGSQEQTPTDSKREAKLPATKTEKLVPPKAHLGCMLEWIFQLSPWAQDLCPKSSKGETKSFTSGITVKSMGEAHFSLPKSLYNRGY